MFDAWMKIQENNTLNLMFRYSNKITRPYQKREKKSEQNVECVCAELIEKKKRGVYLIKSVVNRIDMS